jgi:hypothetical protein
VDALAAPLKLECCIAGGAVTSMRLDKNSEMDESEQSLVSSGPLLDLRALRKCPTS